MDLNHEFTSEEKAALCEIARGGLMQKVIPLEIKKRLIQLGFIEQKLGGLVATSKGKNWAMKNCPKTAFT